MKLLRIIFTILFLYSLEFTKVLKSTVFETEKYFLYSNRFYKNLRDIMGTFCYLQLLPEILHSPTNALFYWYLWLL